MLSEITSKSTTQFKERTLAYEKGNLTFQHTKSLFHRPRLLLFDKRLIAETIAYSDYVGEARSNANKL